MIHDAWPIAKVALNKWLDDKVPKLSAALAFYTMFSLAPTLVIATSIAGLLFDKAKVQTEISAQIRSLIGPSGADAVLAMLQNAGKPGAGVMGAVVGVVTLLIGATAVFVELQDSLNMIWKVKPDSTQVWMGLVRDRFLSFALVLGLGFLLVVSLLASAGLAAATHFISGLIPVSALWHLVDFGVSFGFLAVLFAMIFKILPDADITWADVRFGAGLTALLFTVGKVLIGYYLGMSGVTSVYGAAGSLAVVLFWVYYSAQVIFLGAEFTQVRATWPKANPTTRSPSQAPRSSTSLPAHEF